MKKLILGSFFSCLFFIIKAQSSSSTKSNNKDYSKKMNLILGGNYTYVWDTEELNGVDFNTNYNESTFSLNLATDISRKFRVGLDYKKIYTKGQLSGKNEYYLLGLFQQFKFLQTEKRFAFLELGFYKGNYCTCGADIPYKVNNLSYINWGAGYNTSLYKNLKLDLAFTTAQVLSKIKGRYGFTQYIIGLDYEIKINNRKR